MGFLFQSAIMSLVIPEKFQHILRVMNTNIDGRRKVPFAVTAIKGVGRRYSHVVCKKADVDPKKRAGELHDDDVEKLVTIMSNILDSKIREDLERLKKIRAHRGLRHYWGLRVRGQHTKTTGRRGRTVGVSKKKP